MSSSEFSEWIAFDRVEPLPDPYWVGAMNAQVMASLWGDGKRRYRLEDFLPVKPEKRRQSGAEIAFRFRAYAAAKNAWVESQVQSRVP